MTKIHRFILIIIFLFTTNAFAANETSGYWFGIFPQYKMDDKNSVALQAEYRRLGPFSIGLVRPAYYYQLFSRLKLGLGGDIFIQKNNEYRLWPEITAHLATPTKSTSLWLRFRYEFRFLKGQAHTGQRPRLMLTTQTTLSSYLALHFFDEVFWAEHDFAGPEQRWDRNWLGFRLRMGSDKIYYDVGGFWESIFTTDQNGLVATFSLGGRF